MFTFLPFDTLCILEFIQCLWAFFIRTSKNLMRLNAFFKVYSHKMFWFYSYFLFRKHSYLLTAKITLNVNKSNFYMVWKSYYYYYYVILCMLDPTFVVWLWPQLNWCSMYMSRHSFVSKCLQKISIIVILIFCLNFPASKCS